MFSCKYDSVLFFFKYDVITFSLILYNHIFLNSIHYKSKMFTCFCAGDALFFHCNVLHTSTANDSPDRRWAYLMAYNTKSNNPVYKHHHPFYSPIEKVCVTMCICNPPYTSHIRGIFPNRREDMKI